MELLTEDVSRRQGFLAQQQEMSRRLDAAACANAFSRDVPTLFRSRLCAVQEFELPEIRQQLLALHLDPKDIHRKHWEKAAVSLLVEEFGYYNEQSSGLGLGVAKENLLYLFSNHCGRIVGIDLYQPAFYDGANMTCEDVFACAPFPYRRQRLQIAAMDMRSLDFPDESFDFVWSISSVEHVDSVDELITVFRGVERVLKPGGHAFIATEFSRVRGDPSYGQGFIVLDDVLYPYLVTRLDQLRPLTAVHLYQPHHPSHFFAVKWTTGLGVEVRPCVNLFAGGTFVTPVLLILQKRSGGT